MKETKPNNQFLTRSKKLLLLKKFHAYIIKKIKNHEALLFLPFPPVKKTNELYFRVEFDEQKVKLRWDLLVESKNKKVKDEDISMQQLQPSCFF